MIKGLIAPLLTPFDDKLALDQDNLTPLQNACSTRAVLGWHRLAQLERRCQSAIANARSRLKVW